MSNTTELISGIIVEKFEVDPAKLVPEATIEDIGIDSLDIFDLLFELEEQLGIKVSNDEVKISCYGDLVSLIERIRTEQNK